MPGTNQPDIRTGATPATLTFSTGARRQFLVQNTDGTNALTVAINDSVNPWTLQPGAGMGLYVVGGVAKVALAAAVGNPTYQVCVYA